MNPRLVAALAGGVPFACYLATLSGASYWLDSGELVAAAVELDIAHPPGHPLAALYGKLFCFLPLGSLAFRVALGQAVAAAAATGVMFVACSACVRAAGLRTRALVVPVALAGAWLPAFAFGIWFQAVRPEVYALQGLLCVIAAERLIRLELTGPDGDARPLYAAAFAVGLGLTNHHLMALFLFPALLWSAFRVATQRRSARVIAVCAALGLLALAVYAYLPLRAASNPPANLGAPLTLERFFWVVSAKVYARGFGDEYPQPLSERYADMGVALVDNLNAGTLIAALAGTYLGLRRATSRRLVLMLLLIAGSVLGVRPWLGSVRGNPDAVAYLFAGLCSICALASLALGILGALADFGRGRRPAALALYACAAVALASQWLRHSARADLSNFYATDEIDDARMRLLPPYSLIVLTTPQSVARHFELRATERARPDLAVVPLPFLGYPGVADALVRREPRLRGVMTALLTRERVDAQALQRVAAGAALFVELDPHVSPASYPGLLPAGLLHAAVDSRVVPVALDRAFAAQSQLYARLYRGLGSSLREPETSRQLLHLHYMDALYYAALGARAQSRSSLDRASALYPKDASLRALRTALDDSAPVPVEALLAESLR